MCQIERSNEYFYSRLKLYGLDGFLQPRPDVQEIRFEAVFRALGIQSQHSVLDIGCGTGDFLQYLLNRGVSPRRYTGVDVLQSAVDIASCRTWDHVPAHSRVLNDDVKFHRFDLIGETQRNPYIKEQHDFVVAIAVFGRRDARLSEIDALLKDCLDVAYQHCRKACAVTTFSTYKTEVLVKEAAFDPAELYRIGRRLSERVLLDSTYMPHDQLIALWKEKSFFRMLWEKHGGWDTESGEVEKDVE